MALLLLAFVFSFIMNCFDAAFIDALVVFALGLLFRGLLGSRCDQLGGFERGECGEGFVGVIFVERPGCDWLPVCFH